MTNFWKAHAYYSLYSIYPTSFLWFVKTNYPKNRREILKLDLRHLKHSVSIDRCSHLSLDFMSTKC